MKNLNRIVSLGGLAIIACLIMLSCKDKTGVCTACCGSSGNTYCKDGWTEGECKEWSDMQVNGLSWFWHEGQTCAGRGTPATP